jgi:hypothetical protein
MTPSGGKKMPVPGMPEASFLERVVIRDVMFDSLVEVIADCRG